MTTVTASETINMLQTVPEMLIQLRENIKIMWSQLDPRSDWMVCTSTIENPIMIMVIKQDVLQSRRLSHDEQNQLLQDIVDEVSTPNTAQSPSIFADTDHSKTQANGVLITRLRSLPTTSTSTGKSEVYTIPAALKICMTNGLSRKDVEKAGTTIRHAITKIMTRKR